MRLFRTRAGILVERDRQLFLLQEKDWDLFVNDDALFDKLHSLTSGMKAVAATSGLDEFELLPPIGSQEVWACGVTYYRSKVGREEESKSSGGGDFYARVYEAERPEIFFKATPHRVVGEF